MSATLKIWYDIAIPDALSFKEVADYNGSDWVIHTNCLVFFRFEMLEKFSDVFITSEIGYISLKELLENNPGQYTKKEIRKKHNALKLFLAGAFEWQ